MRARDYGIAIGEGEPGPLNAITDVAGVSVGHATLIITGLYDALVEATEEAIVNAMLAAETMEGRDGNIAYALEGDRLRSVL